MTQTQLASLDSLSLTDLIAIQEALQDKARATERFLREHIEPNKEGFPGLYKSYQSLVTEETNRYFKVKAILDQMM